MLRLAPTITIAVLIGPVLCGLAATLLPAFGYFPALGGESFGFGAFRQLLAVPGLGTSVALSLCTGLAATGLALAIVIAFTSGFYGTRLFALMQQLISPLLSVPHAAAAFGLAFLIAPTGYLFRLASPWLTGSERPLDLLIVQDTFGITMTMGLVAKEIPFLLLVTLAALPQTAARRSNQLARSMGYGRQAAFLHSTWPLVYKQIRLAVFAVIAYSTSVVDVAFILGPTAPPPLAVRLTQWMNDPDVTMRFVASAGALLQLGVTIAAILIWVVIERLAGALLRQFGRTGRRMKRDGATRSVGALLIGLSCAAIIFGLALLGLWSVAGYWAFPDLLPRSFTFSNWTRILPSLGGLMQTTVLVGVLATGIAVLLVLGCLEREARTGRKGGNRALWLLYIPLLVPQVSFVFGLQLFFLWLGLDASLFALALVHLVFVLPYVFLSLSDPWRAWDVRYGRVAHGLGASPLRTFWRIRLPMLLKPVLVAAAVGFAVSIGQYLPTLLIGAGRLPTITTEAVALASGGDRRIIGIFAFLQMTLPFIGFAIAAIIPALLFRKRADMRGVA